MTNRQAAIKVVRQLRRNGFEALFAGGCVRDMLLRRRAKDYDAALAKYTVIVEEFEGTAFGADAEIYLGFVNRVKGDTLAAIAAFESFVARHPDSEDVDYAQKQISRLKGEVPEETE